MPAAVDSASLLIRDIHTLVLMDAGATVLHGAWLAIRDGAIQQVGVPPERPPRAARVLSGRHAVAIPGLVNTHHHLYQTLTRAYAPAADLGLFEWLRALYPVWSRLDEEAVYAAALAGMAELLLSGCTTTSDHHYVFPRGEETLIDAEIAAARRIGIRFHPTRGCMSMGQSRRGLPPDSIVEDEDRILEDCERVIGKYHDPSPGSMLRVALAPCSPFSVSRRLLRETAELARCRGVGLHTHIAETQDEELYCLRRYHRRPLDLLAGAGWLRANTWLAHGVCFNGGEVERLGRARVGIAHCPTSNMRLGSGVAPVRALRAAGCPVGLGVDGSASNDSSHMLAEARQALLVQRLAHGAGALRVRDALHMATVEGARCLGRDDIGTLEPGQRADLALFDLRDIGYSGAGDALSALLLCAPTRVSALIVDGRVVVEGGELRTMSMDAIMKRHQRAARGLVAKRTLRLGQVRDEGTRRNSINRGGRMAAQADSGRPSGLYSPNEAGDCSRTRPLWL